MSKLGVRLREIMRGGAPQAASASSDLCVERERDPARHVVPGEGTGHDFGVDSRATGQPREDSPPSVGHRLARAAAVALGGSVHETTAGPCVIVERLYSCDHRHGQLRIGDWAIHVHHGAPGLSILAGVSWPDRSLHDAGGPTPGGDILFLDIETTGIAGGAGTYAFLVGCGWFESGGFRLCQYFMAGHALERAFLAALCERLETLCGPLVTYNGKTFDVPVLETRFLFNRQRPPLGERLHVDMLHPARRLWRGARPLVNVPGAQSERCTLAALERALFAVQRTADVPGFEIPGRYFAFLRSGDARPLEPVLEHNRLDLVSLAALTARASAMLAETQPTSSRPRECLGLGRLLERAGSSGRAEACYRRAADLASCSWQADDAEVHLAALHALALRCRRTARYPEAAAHWEAIARARHCPPALMREALEALAIHHEHRSRDLEQARVFAERTRRVAGARPDIDRRLARLGRKMRSVAKKDPRDVPLWG